MTEAETIIATLRAHRAELEALGVRHAALFGSRARGDAGPDSDVDIGLRFAPEIEAQRLFDYAGVHANVQRRLHGILKLPVEIADERLMRERVKASYQQDRILAF